MALSDLWSSENLGDTIGALGNLYGGFQGLSNANRVGGQISGLLGQQQQLGAQQAALLQQQQQQAQGAYGNAGANVAAQNAGLQGDIDRLSGNLSALSDPNSPYMQMARQAIERKDAAAGRRSQWGEREVQLAGLLADYVGKYSPGMQSALTNARNQINTNNLGLANIFSTMNNPLASGTSGLMNSLGSAANAANTTGRAAGNSQINNLTSLLGGVKGLGSLAGLFGGSGGSGIMGDMFGTGYGNSFGDGSLMGNTFSPISDYGMDTGGLGGYGYGNLPMGDYFGGGGIGGVPTMWDGGDLNSDSLWD